MKKFFSYCIIAVTALSFWNTNYAFGQTLNEESVISFDANIAVNLDNSVDVTENIIYNTGPFQRHGIYRDIYVHSSQDQKMSIQNISVVDEAGNPYQYSVSNSGKNLRLKIGDPDITFAGQKIYIIKYKATRAVGQLENVDEIYWNVTGNDWNIPIYAAKASVVLPSGVSAVQSACYFGFEGSTDKCGLISNIENVYTFGAPASLGAHQGLTVAVGFPKGVVAVYTYSDTASGFFEKYLSWLVAIILPVLTLIFSLWYWYKKGRDPKGTGVIVPQYNVPDGLTPMEIGVIVNQKITPKYISAEIIYLATLGYLKITELEKKFIGLIKSTDYELTKLKDFEDLPNEFDRSLLQALFGERSLAASLVRSGVANKLPQTALFFLGLSKEKLETAKEKQTQTKQSIKLSELKNHFYQDIPDINKKALDGLLTKGYYKNLGRLKTGPGRIAILIFMSIWASGFLGGLIGGIALGGNPLPIILGIFLSIIIYGIISHFSPAKTEKGVATKEYLLGLKDYLQIAEKDRLIFHNAPDKKPEIFENLLPFAMVLGVAKIWAKEFEDIYNTPPSWYTGSTHGAFNAVAFTDTMSNFSTMASSTISSSPGGSGGGGSSGGGGGGGGGGGW